MLGNATVVILRPTAGTPNRYHDIEAGEPTRIKITGAAVAPRNSTDLRDGGRNGAITGKTLYLPAGTNIVATDSVEVDGLVYEIDGVPGPWTNPFTGWAGGIEVPLRREEG